MESVVSWLVHYDVILQDIIQRYLAPDFLHGFVNFFARKSHLVYPVILLAPFLIWKNWRKAILFTAILAVTLLFADQSSNMLKKSVNRYRPNAYTISLEQKARMERNSFPSSHAANICAATFLFCFFWPFTRWPMLFIAMIVCYGRVYLNKHYPLDVITGGFIGLAYAALLLSLARAIVKKSFPQLLVMFSCDNDRVILKRPLQ